MNHCKKFNIDVHRDNCERIDVNKISPEDFIEKYEKLYKPVVITGVTDNWKANYKWTLEVCFCFCIVLFVNILIYYYVIYRNFQRNTVIKSLNVEKIMKVIVLN